MRGRVIFALAALTFLSLLPPASAGGGAGGCVDSFTASHGNGPYVYESTSGAIVVGAEASQPGNGISVYVVITPSKCENANAGALLALQGASSAALDPACGILLA